MTNECDDVVTRHVEALEVAGTNIMMLRPSIIHPPTHQAKQKADWILIDDDGDYLHAHDCSIWLPNF